MYRFSLQNYIKKFTYQNKKNKIHKIIQNYARLLPIIIASESAAQSYCIFSKTESCCPSEEQQPHKYVTSPLLQTFLKEAEEERMRMQYSAAVFGVELRTDIPGMRRKFHNLNQPAIGVLTYALHACSLIGLQIS